jgi:hypothetical protein
MGSRLEYIFSSDPNSNSGLMLEKELKYSEEIAQRAISLVKFCFSLFIYLGLLIIFMKDFP